MMTDRFLERWHRHEKLRFLVIGGWNTLFGYLTFVILYALWHERLHYLVIAVLAHAIAVVNAFTAHRLLTFRRRGPWLAEFVRFNVTLLVMLGIGLVGLWSLVSIIGMNPLVAQALMTIATVIVSYFAHLGFSFSAP